jgi:hypothetical protein
MNNNALTLDQLQELPATVDLATAARAFSIGRTTAYRLARAGTFPCRVLHVGGAYRIATADLLAALGVTPVRTARTPDRHQATQPNPADRSRTA